MNLAGNLGYGQTHALLSADNAMAPKAAKMERNISGFTTSTYGAKGMIAAGAIHSAGQSEVCKYLQSLLNLEI